MTASGGSVVARPGLVAASDFLNRKIGYLFYVDQKEPATVSEDCPPSELFALLDDEYARAILTATSKQPMSAKALGEVCDASLPTVYRRADRLIECGLLTERTEVVADGHHYSVYEARLKQFTVEIDDGELSVEIEEQPTDDMADRFTDMWEGL